jgi:antitoxin (DNA-binding transcriptional repressor) of toxin-antitoxin stability system
MAVLTIVKTIAAGKFKDICLKTLDDVAKTRTPVTITKRGRPVAKLVPCNAAPKKANLAGSILKETGDPFTSGRGDPADQLIVATARHHEAPLITKDQKIRNYPHVRTLW